MLDIQARRVPLLDTAEEYQKAIRFRLLRLSVAMMVLLCLMLTIVVVVRAFAPGALIWSPLLAAGLFTIVMLPVAIWNRPRFGFYVLVTSACLFTQTPAQESRDPFGIIPFFWNVSTTVETFTRSHAAAAIHVNYAEIVMIVTAVSWLIREVTLRQFVFNKGVFFRSLGIYLLICGFGFAHGILNGGDITVALWELRAQAYMALAYLMAVNLITDRSHAVAVLWCLVISIGLKSLVGTFNYATHPDVSADEGVLSHEDSLLMNIIFYGAILLSLARIEPKLKRAFLIFTTPAVITSLANGRRAGVAAFIVAFPVVCALAAVLLRDQRKRLIAFLTFSSILTAIYLPLAWNSNGKWAQPARAIRSQSDPDERDAGSDYYRLNENANLKFTRDSSPWFGIGYGRPYYVVFEQLGRHDPFANVLPHNGILWIWMRLGHVGFIAFWMFVAAVLVEGPVLLQVIRDPRFQVIGILGIGVFLMNIIYGQYDLTFANYRTSWITGTMVGMLAVLPRLVAMKQEQRAAAGLLRAGGGRGDEVDVREVGEMEVVDPVPSWLRDARDREGAWSPGPDRL
jgi:hypothetical protein